MKIRSVGAELFHADRQTDRYIEVIVAFRNFVNTSNNKFSLNFDVCWTVHYCDNWRIRNN